jgi:hypothetical protein
MTLEGRLQMYDMVHAMNDRLLYLDDKSKEEFVSAIEKLFETYPCPREVRYGSEATIKHGSEASV